MLCRTSFSDEYNSHCFYFSGILVWEGYTVAADKVVLALADTAHNDFVLGDNSIVLEL